MSIVSIEKCSGYEIETLRKTVIKTFDNLGGVEKYIKPGMKVAIKPNLLMRKSPEEAVTTHPEFIKCIGEILIKAGAEVTIVESPAGLYNESRLRSVYSACGIEKIAEEAGIKLNFNLDEIEVNNPQGKILKRLTVLKPLVDADVIINLPKLKTHCQMVYTGAVKNMFGAVPGALKPEYHLRMSQYSEFADALIDIFLSVKPTLNIMDAIIGMEGRGPSAGNPKEIGLILASENAFELDFAALKIIGANPKDVPVVFNAIHRRLCPEGLNHIDVVGEEVDSVKMSDFEIPQLDNLKAMQFFDKGIRKVIMNKLRPYPVFNHKVCIGCADCQKSCPVKIIEMKNNKPKADLSKCIRCFCCQELCPIKAVKIKRPLISNILVKKIKKTNEKKDFCR